VSELVLGNHACAHGAIAAGCRFYAGYPITPSSEVMEEIVRLFPEIDGVFIQMEDEIASLGACIGASWAGKKAMTATSGPGFSLMQENIGYAYMTETPLVIINIQRAGPSTGQATRVGSGDIYQARYGSHGDYEAIALSPWSVEEMFTLTVRAFELSEEFRVPVTLLAEEATGHLRETFEQPKLQKPTARKQPPKTMQPWGNAKTGAMTPMPGFGRGRNLLVTGSTHTELGFRKTQDAQTQKRLVDRIVGKIRNKAEKLHDVELHYMHGASTVVVAYGFTARSALAAVEQAREKGRKVGLLRIKSIWPFPDKIVRRWCRKVRKVIVPEMNSGMIVREVERAARRECVGFSKTMGEVITPQEIMEIL
jgi:2-oxoglutarate ferredoxin oxidoreductase subunit alpha